MTVRSLPRSALVALFGLWAALTLPVTASAQGFLFGEFFQFNLPFHIMLSFFRLEFELLQLLGHCVQFDFQTGLSIGKRFLPHNGFRALPLESLAGCDSFRFQTSQQFLFTRLRLSQALTRLLQTLAGSLDRFFRFFRYLVYFLR